jgi:hypothetical protein
MFKLCAYLSMWNKFLHLYYDIFHILRFFPKKDLRNAKKKQLDSTVFFFTLTQKLNKCSFGAKHGSGHYLTIQRSFHALCKRTHSSSAVDVLKYVRDVCRTTDIFASARARACVRSPRQLGANISVRFWKGRRVLDALKIALSHGASYNIIIQYSDKRKTS